MVTNEDIANDDNALNALSLEELSTYAIKAERAYAISVKDYIEYLKTHFKPCDKITYMDCIEGYKNDCTYIKKEDLGKKFFKYVKDDKNRRMTQYNGTKDEVDEQFGAGIEDNDILIF